ncbi:hypothetical protein OAJ84_02090 [Candidatus Puniceispirillum sp.]|nr:hypothetical protein [Candidatus Puniceispirillum sp.]
MKNDLKKISLLPLVALFISSCGPGTPSKEDVISALGGSDVGILDDMYKISFGDENCYQKNEYEFHCGIWQSIKALETSKVSFNSKEIKRRMAKSGINLNTQEAAAATLFLGSIQMAFWGCSGQSFSMEVKQGTTLNLHHNVTFNLQDDKWVSTRTENDNFSCG